VANPGLEWPETYQPLLDSADGEEPERVPRQRKAKRRGTTAAAAVLASGVAAAAAAHGISQFIADHHIGAPAPLLQCQAPDTITSWWVPDSSPQAREGGPWAVHWDGWTELNGCGETLTIGTETNP
jgi:hypothetical protein